MKKDTTFDEKLNPDTASQEKIKRTDEHLVEYMQSKGENVAAERIKKLTENRAVQENQNNDDLLALDKQLLITNKKILEVLKRIQEDMFDEQDTTIREPSRISALQDIQSNHNIDANKSDSDTGVSIDFPDLGYRPRKENKQDKKTSKNKRTKKPSK